MVRPLRRETTASSPEDGSCRENDAGTREAPEGITPELGSKATDGLAVGRARFGAERERESVGRSDLYKRHRRHQVAPDCREHHHEIDLARSVQAGA